MAGDLIRQVPDVAAAAAAAAAAVSSPAHYTAGLQTVAEDLLVINASMQRMCGQQSRSAE
jgi:hypothetical protein